ncbi:hypothetical protein FCH28_30205 [Streptomyces piniterrae]|uniref:DUF320 domain-containing protein n=1 Tax=Streptomyces piniterrae TaxID=2571125 RepID=A0A4U0MUD9_9ACTN|nr:hypothetical protein [Streptomyces piniterrae]TJZ44599.1 hypothetical protein FCH28_30205 [Streptomyces piniterrae]
MRKLRKAAVVIAALGTVGVGGAGIAHADTVGQLQGSCRSHDLNVNVLGEVGIANGLASNLLNGEGSAGAQVTKLGSSVGCNNSVGGAGE